MGPLTFLCDLKNENASPRTQTLKNPYQLTGHYHSWKLLFLTSKSRCSFIPNSIHVNNPDNYLAVPFTQSYADLFTVITLASPKRLHFVDKLNNAAPKTYSTKREVLPRNLITSRSPRCPGESTPWRLELEAICKLRVLTRLGEVRTQIRSSFGASRALRIANELESCRKWTLCLCWMYSQHENCHRLKVLRNIYFFRCSFTFIS